MGKFLCGFVTGVASIVGLAIISDKIETGRIDKGSYSNQKLEHINIEFENWHFKKEVIKILPSSRKPYTSSDIKKIYCTNCGRKINTKYKFCPYCGTKCV